MENKVQNGPVSGPSLPPESDTSAVINPPAAADVSHLITAAHRVIASAHQHGRKAVALRDHLIARFHFAVARRLARLAWRFAVAGKRRGS